MWQTSNDNLWGVQSYSVNSVTHKKLLKTQTFEKKGKLSSEKSFWAVLSRILECDKPQMTIYEGPQGILAITVEVTGLIL